MGANKGQALWSYGNIVTLEYDESTDQTTEYLVGKIVDGKCKLNAASTTFPAGIIENKPKAAGGASLRLFNGPGIFRVKLSGTVAIDTFLTGSAAGEAEAADADADVVFGRSVESGVDGDVIGFVPYSPTLRSALI